MAGYGNKEKVAIGKTDRLMKEGKTASEIADIIKYPIETVETFMRICIKADEKRKQMANG